MRGAGRTLRVSRIEPERSLCPFRKAVDSVAEDHEKVNHDMQFESFVYCRGCDRDDGTL